MMKRIRIRLMAAGMATMLPLALWTGNAAAQAKEIVLGAMLPLTGSAAQIGLEEQNGIQFATDKVNASGGIRGYKIRIVYEDTQGKPDLGVLAFNRLVDLHQVSGIFTAYSSVTLATAPLATRKKVFVLNPAAQTSKLATASPYLVNTISLAKDEVSIIAKYAAEKLGKKAAVYYDSGSVGIDLRDEFKTAFLAAGGTIVADEAVEFGNTNLRPTLLKIAAAKPDFVFMAATTGPGVTGDQISQIPDYPTAIGTSFFAPFKNYPVTVYHTLVKSSVTGETEKEFNAKFKTPDMAFFSREYANASQIMFKVIDYLLEKGRPVTGENLRTALFEVKTFDTPNGKISFDTNTARREVEIHKLTPAGRTVVEKIAH
jgi:branched-chain amino acid transport system substrate-binding protein